MQNHFDRHGRKLRHHGLDNEKAEAMYGDHEEKHHKKEGKHHDKDDKHHEKEGKHHKEGRKHHEKPEDIDLSNVDA